VIGALARALQHKELACPGITELRVAASMPERTA